MSITVQGVTKYYGEQKALDNVSFEVRTGEIVGFLGPNGAGKSTMMKIITGFIPASSGTVFVNGIETSADNHEIKKITGYLPENNPLYPEMYVREYLGFAASLYKMSGPVKKHIDNVIEITGLAPEQKKKIGALSKGYRQRVGLAQALIHNPQVLILDEATSGLDPNQIVEIRNLIRDAGKEKTILLSTHIMQEVEAICNRVIIIDKGVIVADETKDNIYSKVSRKSQVVHIEFDKGADEGGLKNLPGVVNVKQINAQQWLIDAEGEEDIRPALFSFAVKNNLTVLSLRQEESSLEEVFRHLTGG
jgi:ABC-2 type transport system ATP-binding protein